MALRMLTALFLLLPRATLGVRGWTENELNVDEADADQGMKPTCIRDKENLNADFEADPTSPYSRLVRAWKKEPPAGQDSKMVVVNSPGCEARALVGRAKDRMKRQFKFFDLWVWYLTVSRKKSDEYGPDVKADQLRRLQDQAADVKEELRELAPDTKGLSGGVDTIFFTALDEGTDGPLTDDELGAMELVLGYSAEVNPLKTKLLMLHPWTAWQEGMQMLLKKLGFPTPGSDGWIEFGDAWTFSTESSFVNDLLSTCGQGSKEVTAASVKEYFVGHPAYRRLLSMKAKNAEGKTPSEFAALIGEEGEKRFTDVVAKKLKRASPAARAVIAAMLKEPDRVPYNLDGVPSTKLALGEAVAFTAVLKRDGQIYIPPVARKALRSYCDEDLTAVFDIAPICDAPDAWRYTAITAPSTTSSSTSTSSSVESTSTSSSTTVSTISSTITSTATSTSSSACGSAWSRLWLAGAMLLAMRRQ